MFTDLVPVSCLDQTKLEIGDNYLVAPIKTRTEGLTKERELLGKFNGLNALFEYQQTHQAEARREKSSDDHNRSGFQHFNSFKEAVDTYLKNPKSILDFTEADAQIEGGDASGKSLVYDVTGDIIDISRFLEGEPECMASLTNGNPRNKRVNIIMNLSWAASVDKSVINTRAMRIVRLVDWLESQGIRTQVVGLDSCDCYHLEVIVKHFDEPLDLNDIAITGHSDFLRRVMFRFSEYSETWHRGYGHPATLQNYYSPEKFQSEYNEEFTVFIDGNGRHFSSDTEHVDNAFDKFETNLAEALASDEPGGVLKVL
jgi:hypothetical protein